jgi:hypothetical protein
VSGLGPFAIWSHRTKGLLAAGGRLKRKFFFLTHFEIGSIVLIEVSWYASLIKIAV